jgi:hypothetical protein
MNGAPLYTQNAQDPCDVNDDGAMDVSDAVAVIGELRKSSQNAGAGGAFDVNGDARLTVQDATQVVKELRHKPSPAPAANGPRPVDGTGNNLEHPEWGAAGADFLRQSPADYADGVSAPAGENRPSPRDISNALADQGGEETPSARQLSAMAYAWGQFLDHDIDLTASATSEPISIAVPTGDPWFDPLATGTQTIETTRSGYDPATGTSEANPRQQVNSITAFLDGSMIYGSDAAKATALRTLSGGKLKSSDGNLLPINNAATFPDGTLDMAALGPNDTVFAAGDVRANENVELLSLQTLFMREHNLQADRIAEQNPGLTDEQIYQQARAIVIGEIQAITYKQWLPDILGPSAIKPYRGYRADVNPGIANEFATAGFRFGHSLVGDDVEFLDNDGNEIRDAIPLSEAFFNPGIVSDTGIAPILKYLTSDPSSELDTKVVDGVRNFLFGPPGAGGLDLASLNIARGRDHGLADYNSMRAAYGLPRVSDFSEITSDADTQAKLESLYGSVDNIDAWVGGLAEDHVPGGSVGPLLRSLIGDQFTRLRDGDRFWYQNTFRGDELKRIDHTTLAQVIERNTDLTGLQRDVFFQVDAPRNQGPGNQGPVNQQPGNQEPGGQGPGGQEPGAHEAPPHSGPQAPSQDAPRQDPPPQGPPPQGARPSPEEAFAHLDVDQDDELTPEEFREFHAPPGSNATLDELFRQWDKDRDRLLSETEFLAALMAKR